MTRAELYKVRCQWFKEHWHYQYVFYTDFDYKILNNVMYLKRPGKRSNESFNDMIIMADTETSKEKPNTITRNYVVIWTLSIRAFGVNICTLYGRKPSELTDCINKILSHMQGNTTLIYIHNLSYDWVFLRKFFIAEWGTPAQQLNIKSHYPLFINFANGLKIRDSLILGQRSIEKWANDLNVEHKKAVGKWDYDKVRHQDTKLSKDELTYAECDTLAGVECIQATMDALNKRIYSLPYTATGIPRENVQKLAKANRGKQLFKRLALPIELQDMLELLFHGGYTHANRHVIGMVIDKDYLESDALIKCYDFVSDYPFQMLSKTFPMSKFKPFKKVVKPEYILKNSNKYAFMFKLIMQKPKLKDDFQPMPALQFSKCTKIINPILDNGRVLACEYAEIIINEIDLKVLYDQYDFSRGVAITDIYYAKKGYLPKWFTDYVYECFKDKCKLKGGDPVLYSIAKSKLNALYGLTVQKPVKPLINENYLTGEYSVDENHNRDEEYEKYLKKYNAVLPYSWGCWVTSYAFASLFELGACADLWLYSDTDSCYGVNWNENKVKAYNDKCKAELLANGYGPVEINGKEFWCGIAEEDGSYKEFITVGAKRYAVRNTDDSIKITVAGVPKKNGAKCLNNDLHNFRKDFCFPGEITGKKQHTYFFEEDTWIDKHGNERGDSIDLSPTNYILDTTEVFDWEKLFEDTIEIQVYDEEE